MISHFEDISHAVRPDLIFMMREDNAEDEDVADGGYADPRNAPVQADSSDYDFVCSPCDPDLVQDDEGVSHQVPKGLPEPKPPSAEAQRRHNLTHWPYASVLSSPCSVHGARSVREELSQFRTFIMLTTFNQTERCGNLAKLALSFEYIYIMF